MSDFLVVMRNAVGKDGSKGNAYIGKDYRWSTRDPNEAAVFSQGTADDYANHWRGWYRGFAGTVTIEVIPKETETV